MTTRCNPNYSQEALRVLREGNILGEGESPEAMLERVLDTVAGAESAFGSSRSEIEKVKDEFAGFVQGGLVTLGTPLLTNAGRLPAALSSCVAVPFDAARPLRGYLRLIEAYYRQNMGSGYNLDGAPDPVTVVEELNAHARQLTEAASCERYIGNMANIDIDHPRVVEFVDMKASRDDIVHLNLSVNVTSEFMRALELDASFRLRDGTALRASLLWRRVTQAAWACGDPGVLFLERFNAHNPTPSVGLYTTTAPCAEVALAPGEACVFGYVNLGAFLRPAADGGHRFDFPLLEQVVRSLTRLLDDALEVSLEAYPSIQSKTIMGAKRKIGIGVCGFADLLVKLGLAYGSPGAVRLLRDILLSITFHSKLASVELAARRGSFPALPVSRYVTDQGFLAQKYVLVESGVLRPDDWRSLDGLVREVGLRNATTTALPPSGRSARLLDASTSIEPWFSLVETGSRPKVALVAALEAQATSRDQLREALSVVTTTGSCQSFTPLPAEVRSLLRRAAEIPPEEHLLVVAEASRCVDEGASKTVNLPGDATSERVSFTFLEAWRLGLKAISVYRDGARSTQPEELSGEAA